MVNQAVTEVTMSTSLYDQVVDRAREIRTDAYSMSIGEVISLYKEGDLDIHPEFQRIFRWDRDQQSRLIESILLGIPIPTVFVAQRDDGVWDVIDGVQRLSTILQFVGEYKDEDDIPQQGSILTPGEYLKELDGVGWDDSTPDASNYLDQRLRRDFKRAKLDFSIIKRESDPNAKFDLFQRLNAGSTLSLQEARNCLLIMISRPDYLQLDELSNFAPFVECAAVSEQKESTAYRSELALRFFCQLRYTGGTQQLPEEFGTYLTDWMKRAAEESTSMFDADVFKRTFELLYRELGSDAFRRWDGNRHLGAFSISGFEFITSGVAANVSKWESAAAGSLRSRVEDVWSDPNFKAKSGTGVSSRKRFPQMVNIGRVFFS